MILRKIHYGLVILIICFSNIAWSATAFTGGWRGVLTESKGQWGASDLEFSSLGNPIISYVDNTKTTRKFEASAINKAVTFVPDGGGVATITVLSLTKRSNTLKYKFKLSFEHTSSSGYLTQYYATVNHDLALVACGMTVKKNTDEVRNLVDPTGSSTGGRYSYSYAGMFHK